MIFDIQDVVLDFPQVSCIPDPVYMHVVTIYTCVSVHNFMDDNVTFCQAYNRIDGVILLHVSNYYYLKCK